VTFAFSDHSPIEESSDAVGILVLANCYQISRLVTLCELYISKMVEVRFFFLFRQFTFTEPMKKKLESITGIRKRKKEGRTVTGLNKCEQLTH
jgi:hypothetical protein